MRKNDIDGATGDANAILGRSPKSAEGHRLMALILWRQRDTEGALAECAQALASDPDSLSMMALEAVGLWRQSGAWENHWRKSTAPFIRNFSGIRRKIMRRKKAFCF